MNTIKISFLAFTLGLMSFASVSSIVWKSESIDVGEIQQGKPKAIVFDFKNTGKTDVIITNVQVSCGCTAADYTRKAIKAGKSGFITVTYNAANVGAFTKTATVTTNADASPKVLTLKGTVKAIVPQS
jgi:hypothetical protein